MTKNAVFFRTIKGKRRNKSFTEEKFAM